MKKKLLSLALALTMVVAVLTGCGSTGSGNAAGSAGGEGQTTASSDKNSVNTTGVLRVGMECGYAPYNWTQNDDSNGAVPIADTKDYAYGYDVMMAKKLADELGYTLEIYKIDWDSLPIAVQSGKIDCVIAGQSITADRLKTVDFTSPYYYASVVGLTRDDTKYVDVKNVKDLDGVKATSQLNTIWYTVLDQIPNVDKLAPMETVPNMLVALNAGQIDFVCTDMPTAMAACVAYPNFKIIDFEGGTGFEVSDEDINIGISVKKGNTELTDKLNSVLDTMTADDFETMMNDAIKVQPLSEA